jgi:hypothetical protein
MIRRARLLAAATVLGMCVGACTSVTPTASPPASSIVTFAPTPTARPTIAGPAWVQVAAERWLPGSPEWVALANPDVPYRFGGSAHDNPDGITFTANLARRWWDAWFANPVDRGLVPPGLQPGALVLSADEVKRVAELQAGTLQPAPADYNPLGVPTVP